MCSTLNCSFQEESLVRNETIFSTMKGFRVCHPKNMSLWHKAYFELKATDKKQTLDELSALFQLPKSRK